MAENLLVLLCGVIMIYIGLIAIYKKHFRGSWSESSDDAKDYNGLPAVLHGLIFMGFGMFFIFASFHNILSE